MDNSLKQKDREDRASVQIEEVYQGKIYRLKRETLDFEDGSSHSWEIIEHPGAVAILPILNDGHLLLIKQWRRAVGKILYEIPAGMLDPGETPVGCAQRELQEETGHRAELLTRMGGFYSAPGFCNEYIHLYRAEKLVKSSLPQDEHEGIDLVTCKLSEVIHMIESGIIEDAKTLYALLRYLARCQNA